jgi:hypothetical protein
MSEMAVDLYSPLNEGDDEIRLINILPYASRGSIVSCTLETVSLKSLTAEYQDFVKASKTTGRKRVVEWTRIQDSLQNSLHEGKSGPSISNKVNTNGHGHRFIWGDFAALSYVWGDPQDTAHILLNSQKIKVQRGLEMALHALSSRADFSARYKLWVDAICINQQDDQERARQIGRMKHIYGDARAVIAWIGEQENSSDLAIDLLKDLSDARLKDCGEKLEERLRGDPEYLGFGGWSALHEFMHREYWSRLWIIQEIILGSSSVVLRCGNASIDWTTFCEGIGFLFEYLWTVKDPIFQQETFRRHPQRRAAWGTTPFHLVFRDLWPLSRNIERGGDDHLSFGQLLDLAKAGNSQDHRDKVYGLVGIMDSDIADNVVPDYKLPPSHVYAAIARTFICVHGNLEAIREGNPWGSTNSPSWAADWTWPGRIRFGRVISDPWGPFWRPKGLPRSFRLASPYCASGEQTMNALFSGDGMTLTCRGFLVDEVDGLSAREDGFFAWSSHTIHQGTSVKNAYSSPEKVSEAMYRTLVMDRVAGSSKASERHAAMLNMPSRFEFAESQFRRLGWTWLSNQGGYYFRWSGWRLANRAFKVMGTPLDHYFREAIPDDASEYDYTEAYSCYNRTSSARRFMTTKNGYMGWAPDNMYGTDECQVIPGDKIAIVFGCSTPIVIRPDGASFQVLGEAYIHGIMDGEAMEFLRSGQYQAQDLTFS